MLFHDAPSFRIYFGTARDKLMPQQYQHYGPDIKLLEIKPYSRIKKLLGLQSLMFLKQVHGNQGYVISREEVAPIIPFQHEGDFLITADTHSGLGIMTADCLPIVFYDTHNNVIAVIHAGWRGSMQEIAQKTLETMHQKFNTQAHNITVFFGPSAKVCCYSVGQELLASLEAFDYADDVIHYHNDVPFFDLPRFNRLQLQACGVKSEAFHTDYNICTICDPMFYSYRRDGEKAGRQMTVVSLK